MIRHAERRMGEELTPEKLRAGYMWGKWVQEDYDAGTPRKVNNFIVNPTVPTCFGKRKSQIIQYFQVFFEIA